MKNKFWSDLVLLFFALSTASIGVSGFLWNWGWIGSQPLKGEMVSDNSRHLVAEMLTAMGVSEFENSYANLLEQGATFEGVYRGMVYSDWFRGVEKKSASDKCKNNSFDSFLEDYWRYSITFRSLYRWTREQVVDSRVSAEAFSGLGHALQGENPSTRAKMLGDIPAGVGESSAEDENQLEAFYSFYEFQRKERRELFEPVLRRLFAGASQRQLARFLAESWLTATQAEGWPDAFSSEIVRWNERLAPYLPSPLKNSVRYSTREGAWRGWVVEVGRDRSQWEILYRIHLWFQLHCYS